MINECSVCGVIKGVTYLDENGAQGVTEIAIVVDGSTTTWTAGWYVVKSDVTIDSRVTASGDVHLILVDGYTLTVNGGINVAERNSLIIYAQSDGENMGALTRLTGAA